MKKLFLLPLFVAGSMTMANAQVMTTTTGAPTTSGAVRENGPVMTFDHLEHNFGNIKQGESVTHEFRFKNTGKEPLIINNAVGSCGCTVPEWPKEPIAPGREGIIKVTFNSAGKANVQDKQVTITYDTDKSIVLHMKGTVDVPATPATGTATPATGGGAATATPAPTATKGGTTTTTPAPAPAKGGATTAPATTKSSTPKATTAKPAATTTAKPAPAPAAKPAEATKDGGN
jgi:Protein of unknown function (DUF1573)